jgi:hypothetical protein
VKVYRETGDAEDRWSVVHDASPVLSLGAGSYVQNALITTSQDVYAVLLVSGKPYSIVAVDPSSY